VVDLCDPTGPHGSHDVSTEWRREHQTFSPCRAQTCHLSLDIHDAAKVGEGAFPAGFQPFNPFACNFHAFLVRSCIKLASRIKKMRVLDDLLVAFSVLYPINEFRLRVPPR